MSQRLTEVVTCGARDCPRHRRDQFNAATRCTAARPPHWPALEDRRWYGRAIATPQQPPAPSK